MKKFCNLREKERERGSERERESTEKKKSMRENF